MQSREVAPLNVVVFCGARIGHNVQQTEAVRAFGRAIGEAGYRLTYGGGTSGLMGVLASAAHDAGADVLGIIPDFLIARGGGGAFAGRQIVAGSMHERKRQMFDLADVFVALPGGLGTLEETLEVITWRQLGIHDRPILICNLDGWADALIGALNACVASGFADLTDARLWEVVADGPGAINRLGEFGTWARHVTPT